MVIVKSGTASKTPASPSTLTATGVAVDRTTPSGREAVTVTASPAPPSSTSVLSNDNRIIMSSSTTVKTAGFTFTSGALPTTDKVLSSLGSELSVMGMLNTPEV